MSLECANKLVDGLVACAREGIRMKIYRYRHIDRKKVRELETEKDVQREKGAFLKL